MLPLEPFQNWVSSEKKLGVGRAGEKRNMLSFPINFGFSFMKQLHLEESNSLELWTKRSAGKLVQTLPAEQGLLISWQGGEHTQHYFCPCSLVNDICVLWRVQLRHQCSCHEKFFYIWIAAFAILIHFSANVGAHLMIFTNFNPSLLVFEAIVFSKEITCQEYFVQLSGKQEKVKVLC